MAFVVTHYLLKYINTKILTKTYPSLNNLNIELTINNVAEFSISDFRNPFDVCTFLKIYNRIYFTRQT